MDKDELKGLLTGSKETDIATLLSAKEQAKRRLLEDPTDQNLRAFERASKILADLSGEGDEKSLTFANRAEALRHLKGLGYKIGKTKFFTDAKQGLIKFEPDGTITEKALDRYIRLTGIQKFSEIGKNPAEEKEGVLFEKARREVEKLNEQIRELKIKNEALEKQYFKRSEFEMELAARAAVFESELKQNFRTHAERLTRTVEGNPLRAMALAEALETILDRALRTFADTKRFHVIFVEGSEDSRGQGGE